MAGKREPSNRTESPKGTAVRAPVDPALRLRQWRSFQLVLGVAAFWWLLLVIGVVSSANPPRFEAFLIEQADFVAEAQLESAMASELSVTGCWNNPTHPAKDWCAAYPKIPREAFPSETEIHAGVKYLVPLKEVQGKPRWLHIGMYERPGETPAPARVRITPVLATDVTRVELERTLNDLKRPLPEGRARLEQR